VARGSLTHMGVTRWKIAGEVFDLSARGWIMGVLNVTPDSFSDGGRFFQTPQALAQARKMIANGANILDIGGESTRPGAEPVDPGEEKRRVIPIIRELAGEALISIDTSKAEVAAAALDAGARIVSDVTGGRGDDAMWPLLAERAAGCIIMHMQGTPRTMQRAPSYHDVILEVGDFFRQQFACAVKFGLDPMTLAFDPGIGFGKTLEHNLSLLKNLPRLRVEDRPLVVGVSRKAFLGKISGHNGSMDNRLLPSVAFTSLLRMNGADVLRVHDVEENVEALRVADALRSVP
jgi:dihydropteroate synthase